MWVSVWSIWCTYVRKYLTFQSTCFPPGQCRQTTPPPPPPLHRWNPVGQELAHTYVYAGLFLFVRTPTRPWADIRRNLSGGKQRSALLNAHRVLLRVKVLSVQTRTWKVLWEEGQTCYPAARREEEEGECGSRRTTSRHPHPPLSTISQGSSVLQGQYIGG